MIDTISNIVVNNGVAIGMLLYFVYRDNKFIDSIVASLKELEDSIKVLSNKIDNQTKEIE